ncbi:HSP20-like chaperone [Scenedesmus sp. NREL 46B-D3]|nr:HSP20-like chaperone [Scenedesmus sp. NREL 46B-D3]
MAKQWKETGSVSGRVFWPGGGVEFGPNRSKSGDSQQQQQQQGKASTPQLPVDVADAPEGFYTLYADIPGLSKADLSIKLSKERVLTISGERKAPLADAPLQQQERVMGAFERRWQLPEDAEGEGISAKVADGVLTITVPKKQPEPEPVDEQQDIFIA